MDTGLHSNIGQRLKAVEKYLEGEEVFLANYSDGLSDLPLPAYLAHFEAMDKVASFLSVRPSQSFHLVSAGPDGLVTDIRSVEESDYLINGGFFVFKKAIFDHLAEGEELVEAPFRRLIGKGELVAYRHRGFWAAIDTFKDKQRFDDMESRGNMPWAVWKNGPDSGFRPAPSESRPPDRRAAERGR